MRDMKDEGKLWWLFFQATKALRKPVRFDPDRLGMSCDDALVGKDTTLVSFAGHARKNGIWPVKAPHEIVWFFQQFDRVERLIDTCVHRQCEHRCLYMQSLVSAVPAFGYTCLPMSNAFNMLFRDLGQQRCAGKGKIDDQ